MIKMRVKLKIMNLIFKKMN